MTRRKKRPSNNPYGRPSSGLSEASVLVRGPALLVAAAQLAAEKEGIALSEWWRRAARVRLGWREVLDK